MDALVSKAATILLSLHPGPASETSAFNRMRAFNSRRAGPFPLRISVSSCWRSSPLSLTTYFFTEISFLAIILSIVRIIAKEMAGDVPPWLAKGNFSASEITAILKEFVQTVVRRYRGRVMGWDVTWGMFDMLGKPGENFWSKAVGDDYIAQIIAWAHEADPQAKLFLNSNYAFDVVGPRSNAVYDLLQKFRSRGVAVDGIALANTIVLDQLPKLQDFVTNMSRLAALGLEIHLVEFEVSVKLPPSEQDLQRQAAVYRDYLSTCLSFPSCKLFATGGVSDKDAYAPQR